MPAGSVFLLVIFNLRRGEKNNHLLIEEEESLLLPFFIGMTAATRGHLKRQQQKGAADDDVMPGGWKMTSPIIYIGLHNFHVLLFFFAASSHRHDVEVLYRVAQGQQQQRQ